MTHLLIAGPTLIQFVRKKDSAIGNDDEYNALHKLPVMRQMKPYLTTTKQLASQSLFPMHTLTTTELVWAAC